MTFFIHKSGQGCYRVSPVNTDFEEPAIANKLEEPKKVYTALKVVFIPLLESRKYFACKWVLNKWAFNDN